MDNKGSLGVTFNDLNVFGSDLTREFQHDAASYLLEFPRFIARILRRHKTKRAHILHNFSGQVNHGEMLLVLGRPGSGCSTFLKVIGGELLGLHVAPTSNIKYDGQCILKGNAIYLSELDVHFPELTLGQTLSFALATQKSSSTGISDTDEVGRDVAAKFNLEAAYRSRIGNAMIRGISGGEKRRTSIAEVFISESPLQCWDNSTRGLDSATALSFVQLLRSSLTKTQAVVLMSIYQASNDIYENFDKVMLLYEGRQIYFGPTELAVEYFFALGFEKQARATTADFLTSITHPAERRIRDGYKDQAPRSAEEFEDRWKRSELAKALLGRLTSAASKEGHDQNNELRRHTRESRVYKISIRSQISVCIQRGFQRLRNHYVPAVAATVGNTIIAIVVGTAYYDLPENTDGMDKRAVLLFFSLMINAYTPAFDVLAMWAQRPIVEKHHRYAFYRPFTESIASIICDLPTKLATAVMFNITLYFMTNLRRSAGAFFTYLVFMFATILTMSMFFRTVGSLSRTVEQSMVPSSMFILIFSAYTGYIIPIKDMVSWLAWLRRLNPIAFAYESLMINEFSHREFPCSRIIPSGAKYDEGDQDHKVCAVIGAGAGQINVDGSFFIARKYSYKEQHLWRNMGVILAMFIIIGTIHLIAAEYVPAQRSRGEVLLFRKRSKKPSKVGEDEESGYSGERVVTPCEPKKPVRMVDVDTKEITTFPTPKPTPATDRAVFHWSQVEYSIQLKDGPRRILQNIDGWIRPGTLTALMGVTGAGKTTLLDVLAHRTTSGRVKGDFYLGNEVPDHNFQRKIGYVQQDDIHLPTTTVREALDFSARLRRPNHESSNRTHQIQDVLDLLEMTPYADAIVGVPGEGLNVEQRKRLSIAVEMVAKPEILLFLDEPTSGLDSQTAWSICMVLRRLASAGQAILITIHQPSSQLFQLFDRLLLLDSKGRVTYFGDIGSDASTVINYFERNGSGKCDVSNNPAEWILQVTTDIESDETVAWHEKWARSPEREDVLRAISEFKSPQSDQQSGVLVSEGKYATSLTTQLLVVTQRMFQEYWRDPVYIYCKMALCVVTTLLNGLSFFNTKLDIQGITNIFFSVFLFTQLFSTIDQQVIPRFIDGRSLFEARERRSRSYSWTVFITANVVVELFWQTIASGLVFVTWYYPTGLWKYHDPSFPAAERGGLAFGVIWLFCLWISTFSQAVAAGIDYAETAVQIATLFFWLSLVFCGVLVTPDDLPRFWRFVYRASPLTYFIDGAVSAGLANTAIKCSDVEMLHLVPPLGKTCEEYLGTWIKMAGGYLETPSATQGCVYCPVSDTNMLLSNYGINAKNRWNNFAYLVVYVAFNVVATFGIYWIVREKRWRSHR